MNESDWSRSLPPPPQGWAKLNARLARADTERRRELRALRATAFALLTLVVISTQFWPGTHAIVLPKNKLLLNDLKGQVHLDGAAAVPVSGAAPKVRYYRAL